MNSKVISVIALAVSGVALGLAGYTYKNHRKLSRHFDRLLDVLIAEDITTNKANDDIDDLDKELTLEEYAKKEEEIINEDAEKTVDGEYAPEKSIDDEESTGGIDSNPTSDDTTLN